MEGLKATHDLITSSINRDLLLAQSKLKTVTTDYEQQKSHLIDALLVKDRLQQELAVAKEQRPSQPPAEQSTRDEQQDAEARAHEEIVNAARHADQKVRNLSGGQEHLPRSLSSKSMLGALLASTTADPESRPQPREPKAISDCFRSNASRRAAAELSFERTATSNLLQRRRPFSHHDIFLSLRHHCMVNLKVDRCNAEINRGLKAQTNKRRSGSKLRMQSFKTFNNNSKLRRILVLLRRRYGSNSLPSYFISTAC